MAKLIGTDPNQVPTNADLGTMAYQDEDNLAVGEVHSDNQTIVSTKSTNAFSVTTNTGSNVALSIGGSSTINGVTSGAQAFYIMNVARDSGSGKSTYFNGNIGFPNGYGIDFSASQGGGASSSVLDDYEEGTWTPVLSGNAGNVVSNVQYGYYTKIGNLVTLTGSYSWNSSGSNANNFTKITGLPFTGSSDTNSRGGGSAGAVNGFADADGLVLVVDPGATQAWLINREGTAFSHYNTVSASGAIYGFCITYRTDA